MPLDVEKVMSRVREELARRGGQGVPTLQGAATEHPVAWAGSIPPLPTKPEYTIHELLVYADRAFLENAYRAVLRRMPDPQGLETHLGKLRSGEATKVEVLAHLRWSPEGVARGVHVDGLLIPYTVQRWRRKRIVGPVISWLLGLLRVGSFSSRVAMTEVTQARDVFSLADHVERIANQMGARSASLEEMSWQNHQRLRDLAGALEAQAANTSAIAQGIEDRIQQLNADREEQIANAHSMAQALNVRLDGLLAEHVAHVDRTRQVSLDLERRLDEQLAGQNERLAEVQALGRDLGERSNVLEAAIHQAAEKLDRLSSALARREELEDSLRRVVDGLQENLTAKDSLLVSHGHHLAAQGHALAQIEQERTRREQLERSLDPLYVAFEDQFRGSAELIRARALPYLDFIRDAQIGGPATPILDIGCGRGDWLDVLREHGFVASGVDSNRAFVDICRNRGLDVVVGDALEHLRAMPDGSLGGVTGMHIAEHLPFETLIELLDQCRRVLCVGGLIALETPNPENLTVATVNFYMDPTHRNPLPPEAFRWIVEARGFQMVRIERWTVARDMGAPPLVDDTAPGAGSMNVLLSQLHAAPDYAIIARRL